MKCVFDTCLNEAHILCLGDTVLVVKTLLLSTFCKTEVTAENPGVKLVLVAAPGKQARLEPGIGVRLYKIRSMEK